MLTIGIVGLSIDLALRITARRCHATARYAI
jgi:hypothetical protein